VGKNISFTMLHKARTILRMAVTLRPTAGPLTSCKAASRPPLAAVVGELNGGGGGAELAARTSANSGNAESGRHSVSFSSFAKDCPLSRLSAIHRRISSAVTELYGF